MKAVVQRVKSASVTVDGHITGEINDGLLILLGVAKGDGADEVELLAKKTAELRIFCDENGKMNRSLLDIGGGALVVSNFTLAADVRKGTRPSFDTAMPPAEAETLYNAFVDRLKEIGVKSVATGEFGAKMRVDMSGDGPVTILLDTDIWRPRA